MVQPLWRTVWRFLKNQNIEFPLDPAVPLLGLDPEKIIIGKDKRTPVFRAALFTSQDRETTKLSADRKMKMLYRYAMEYYSVLGVGWSQDVGSWAPDCR